jgi:dolichol kinase
MKKDSKLHKGHFFLPYYYSRHFSVIEYSLIKHCILSYLRPYLRLFLPFYGWLATFAKKRQKNGGINSFVFLSSPTG